MGRKTRKKKNNFLQKILFFGAIAVVIGIVVFLLTRPPKYPLQGGHQVNFDQSLGISEESQQAVYNALKEWDEKFQCGTDIRVSRLEGFTDEIDANGQVFHTMAISIPGRIGYNFPTIKGREDLRQVTLHEATHACRESERRLESALLLSDASFGAATVTGYVGYGATTENPEVYISYCDEALADYNALAFERYQSSHPGYKALAQLLIQKFPDQHNILAELGKKNDFPGFVALYYNIPRDKVTITEIERMLHLCEVTFEKGSAQQ